MTHELKTWPEYFQAIFENKKTFELRVNDRNYQVGEILLLREFDPETKQYSGREIKRYVTYIAANLEHFGLDHDCVIMSIADYAGAIKHLQPLEG